MALLPARGQRGWSGGGRTAGDTGGRPGRPASGAALRPDPRTQPAVQPDARIQLRVAAHVGKVYHDGHGFAGDAASHLFRLLQAEGLKQRLATSGSDLAFIASDYFYDTVLLCAAL